MGCGVRGEGLSDLDEEERKKGGLVCLLKAVIFFYVSVLVIPFNLFILYYNILSYFYLLL